MPPDAFGPFRVLHQIGAGTLGPVFRAYDSQHERLVAVKVFHLDLQPERVEELVGDFQRLIDANLVHPAIAAPIATGLAGKFAYLAQDFVAADSLDIVIREFGPVPPDEAARVALQLAGALDFAATANVWHGGLHPQDVFLASDDARLTGLGIAQILEHVMVPMTVRRPYTAPERIAGGEWDRRADVFGLAVVIAEMIGGRRLSGSGPRAVQGLLGATGADADLLRAVFARALSDDPELRFATALAFAQALKQATQGAVGEVSAPRGLPETAIEARLPLADPVAFVPELTVLDDLIMAEPVDPLSDFDPAGSVPVVTQVPQVAQVHEVLESHARVLEPHAREDDWDLKQRIQEIDSLLLNPVKEPTIETPVTETTIEKLETKVIPAPPSPPRPGGDATAAAAGPVADAPLKRPAPPVQPTPRPIESRSQSAVWPLALALLVGLIVGVALGFFVFADRAGRTVDAPTQADGSVTPDRPLSSLSSPGASSSTPALGTPPAAAAASAPTAGAPASLAPAGHATQGTSDTSRTPGGEVTAPVNEPVAPSSQAPSTPVVSPRPVEHPAERPKGDRADRLAAVRPPTVAETPAAATEVTGRVLVRSTPAGARVVLDGKEVGTTPVTVRALSFGTHLVRISRDGYLDDERRVAVSAKRPAQSLIVELSRPREIRPEGTEAAARFTAALVVESRPPGAVVFLNGDRVGTTPLTLDTVATGSQALRLEMDGYRRWTSSVRVVAGERNRITASLEQ